MKNSPFVSIVIPAYNEEKYIKLVLESLKRQSYPRNRYEIIVVDNNSSDNTPIIARSLADVFSSFTSKPVGKVRNHGAALSKGDILLFLDSDCKVDFDWIKKCVNLLEKDKNKVFGGGINLRGNPFFYEKHWLLNSKEGGLLPKELIGASIAIRKSHFNLVKGFSTTLTAGEDSQLHKELIDAGVIVEMTREISVIHLGNATTAGSFIKRQIWHSEGYATRLAQAIKEPVFLFLCVFIFFHFMIVFNTGNSIFHIGLIGILIFVRSSHRIKSSHNYNNYKNLFSIMFLDYLYFLGRTIGLFKGIIKRIL